MPLLYAGAEAVSSDFQILEMQMQIPARRRFRAGVQGYLLGIKMPARMAMKPTHRPPIASIPEKVFRGSAAQQRLRSRQAKPKRMALMLEGIIWVPVLYFLDIG